MSSKSASFNKNVLTLVSGTGLAQFITMVSAPFITRLYTPDDMGYFTVIMSIAGFIAIAGTFRYEMAIVLPRDDEEASGVFSLSALILVCVSLFTALGVYLAKQFQAFGLEEIHYTYAGIIPLLVFTIGCGNILQHWLNRRRQYRMISISKTLNSVGVNSLTIWMGVASLGLGGLVMGSLLGTFVFVVALVFSLNRADRKILTLLGYGKMQSQARTYRKLAITNTPQALIEAFQVHGVVYMLILFFSSTVIGWYGLALRVLQAPLWLIGSSLSQVFFREASDLVGDGASTLRPLMMKAFKVSTAIAVPLVVVLVFFGPDMFSLVFGEGWAPSGQYAAILAPWLGLDFIRYVIGQLPVVLNRTGTMFRITLVGNLFLVGFVASGAYFFNDIVVTLSMVSAVMSVYTVGVIVWIMRLTGNKS
jgi:O-antigen/teichoic acid export membrane protein